MRWFFPIVFALFLFGCLQPETKYVCPDGRVIENPQACIASEQPAPKAIEEAATTPVPEPVFVAPPKPSIAPPSSENLAALERGILEEINRAREKEKLSPLLWNERAASAARKYMKTLAEQERFAHTGAEGEDVHDRLIAEGLFHFVVNENLAQFPYQGQMPNASSVVNGWLKSPGHRSNIIDADKIYDHAGVGAFCTTDYCNFAYSAVALGRSSEVDLDNNVMTFVYLNDPGYGFGRTVRMRLQVEDSNYPLDVYLVPDSSSFDTAKTIGAKEFEMRRFEYFKNFESTKKVDYVLNASVGTGVIIINMGTGSALFELKTSIVD
ncbi:CAP domain-containing protein [Candidatus Micrarchaeota archaeon]|nr:CAP domain-containing protein [Candidatus Micrarchaeota archaeon]